MSIELKPCPFCAAEARLIQEPGGWIACCTYNCASFYSYISPEHAASRWNTRLERESIGRDEFVYPKGYGPGDPQSVIDRAMREEDARAVLAEILPGFRADVDEAAALQAIIRVLQQRRRGRDHD